MVIGQRAPAFSLQDLDGTRHRLTDYRGRTCIVNFWSCECPHSERTDALLMNWISAWGGSVALLAIASNTNGSSSALSVAAAARRLPVVLIDARHRVADLYQAQITPHVFVIDAEGLLRYAGAVDDVNFERRRPERYFVREVVQALLDGISPPITTTQPYGCALVRHALE